MSGRETVSGVVVWKTACDPFRRWPEEDSETELECKEGTEQPHFNVGAFPRRRECDIPHGCLDPCHRELFTLKSSVDYLDQAFTLIWLQYEHK